MLLWFTVSVKWGSTPGWCLGRFSTHCRNVPRLPMFRSSILCMVSKQGLHCLVWWGPFQFWHIAAWQCRADPCWGSNGDWYCPGHYISPSKLQHPKQYWCTTAPIMINQSCAACQRLLSSMFKALVLFHAVLILNSRRLHLHESKKPARNPMLYTAALSARPILNTVGVAPLKWVSKLLRSMSAGLQHIWHRPRSLSEVSQIVRQFGPRGIHPALHLSERWVTNSGLRNA